MGSSTTLLEQAVKESIGTSVSSPVHALPRHADLDWQILRGDASLLDDVADEWNAICDSGQFRYVFLRPPLVRAYLDAFAPNSPLMLLTARPRGQRVALFPLIEPTFGPSRFGLRWLHPAGNIHFPLIEVISRHENPDQVAHELWAVLRTLKHWDVLELDTVPLGGIADRVRQLAEGAGRTAHVHRATEAPFLRIPVAETLDDLINLQRTSKRQQLRRSLRRLEKLGEVGFVEVRSDGDRDRLFQAYRQFVDLEHSSWKGSTDCSIASSPHLNAFFTQLLDDPDARDLLRLHILTCDGEPVAASIGMVSGTTMFGLRIAFSDTYRSASPGHLLILHLIHALHLQGFETLDFCDGPSEYKTAWTQTASPIGYIFLFNSGWRARLAYGGLFQVLPRLTPVLESKWFRKVSRRVMD